MSRFLFDFSFGVRRVDGYVSDIWRASTSQLGDFHLVTESICGTEKYSFGKSGMCRSEYDRPAGTPAAIRDREAYKWRRAKTPPRGSGSASRVAWIAFPTDYLSRPGAEADDETLWIDAAPAGGATYVEIAYAAESEAGMRGVIDIMQDRTLVGSTTLPNGELLVIFCYHADWENKDLRVAGDASAAEIEFCALDPLDTGRPLRHWFGPEPKDGEAVMLLELGGAAVAAPAADL